MILIEDNFKDLAKIVSVLKHFKGLTVLDLRLLFKTLVENKQKNLFFHRKKAANANNYPPIKMPKRELTSSYFDIAHDPRRPTENLIYCDRLSADLIRRTNYRKSFYQKLLNTLKARSSIP